MHEHFAGGHVELIKQTIDILCVTVCLFHRYNKHTLKTYTQLNRNPFSESGEKKAHKIQAVHFRVRHFICLDFSHNNTIYR